MLFYGWQATNPFNYFFINIILSCVVVITNPLTNISSYRIPRRNRLLPFAGICWFQFTKVFFFQLRNSLLIFGGWWDLLIVHVSRHRWCSQWEYICINMVLPYMCIISSALETLFPSNGTQSNQSKTGTQKIHTQNKHTRNEKKKYIAPMYLHINYLA